MLENLIQQIRSYLLFLQINNFPETLIQVCSNELLYNDAIEFTKKLGEKGTKYELQVWDDLWHAWHFFNKRVFRCS